MNRDVLLGLQERWGALLFSTLIRDNVSLAEAPSDGHNIFEYRPKSYGAQDYSALAKEFLARVKTINNFFHKKEETNGTWQPWQTVHTKD